jgi:hypothetical protein
VGSAGTPLIRLSTWIDWPLLLGAISIAISAYYVNQHLSIVHLFIESSLGCICGLAVSTVFRMIFFERFDLCENGIVLLRTTYWPWDKVQLSLWNRDINGRLVLCNGWRRVITRVSEDQRAAVDAVLREKIQRGD